MEDRRLLSVTTEGDAILRADQLRANFSSFGVNGSDVKIGVIARGVQNLTAVQGQGELSAVTVKDGNLGVEDGGTALLEIIHDIAPNAALYFARATTPADVISSISWLVSQGVNAITSDFYYFFDQPFFEDGAVAQAVRNATTSNDVTFIVPAGNLRTVHYQGDYLASGLTFTGNGELHAFNFGGVLDTRMRITVPAGSTVQVEFQYSNPFSAVTDAYTVIYQPTPQVSVVNVPLTGPATSTILFNNSATPQDVILRIERSPSSAPQNLEIFARGATSIGRVGSTLPFFATNSVVQQAAVSEAITVVDIPAADIGHDNVNESASLGGSLIFFPSLTNRATPDGAGISGVSTYAGAHYSLGALSPSGVAAAHVAGLVGLLIDSNKQLKTAPELVQEFLNRSAIDIELAGPDVEAGFGRYDALNAVGYLQTRMGDYNRDGSVDAADYTVWRNTLGQNGPSITLQADGNGNGQVDEADYNHWKANYGRVLGEAAPGSGSGSISIPGDYDASGTVNDDDYGVWYGTLGSTTNLAADGNFNGIVDMADFAVWEEARGVTTADFVAGDYNANGVVESTDYDLWKATFGSTTQLAADGNGNGQVDAGDYVVWRNNLGATTAARWPLILGGTGGMPLEIPDEAPRVTGLAVSGSTSVHPEFAFSTVDGSGEQLRSVPVGGLDSISITFSEEVFVTNADLVLTSMQGGVIPPIAQFSYDLPSHTATWRFNSPLAPGQYLVRLSDAVIDLDWDSLDGEFTNPWSLTAAAGSSSTFPSGDGEAGGAFRFRFTNLSGDYNGDNGTGAADYTVWANNNGLTGAISTRQGDGTGDGLVTSADYSVWTSQYGADFVNWPSIEPGAILVSTLVDESDGNHSLGDLSLREALAIAAAQAGHDIIEFAPSLFAGGPATITLAYEGPDSDAHVDQLTVSSDVTIAGPGADKLTISRTGSGRLFEINADVTAAIVGATITGGSYFPVPGISSPYVGGAIHNRGHLTLDGAVLRNNSSLNGGAISQDSAGVTGASLKIVDSTIRNNSAATVGGGLYIETGTVEIASSTFSANTASVLGGGIYSSNASALDVTNSTISGNSSIGINAFGAAGTINIVNSTVTNNTPSGVMPANLSAGGVTGSNIKLVNTIVAGNSGGDINGTFATASHHNLIGDGSEGNLAGGANNNQVGTAAAPIDAKLSALADYGGPTLTHTLLYGSPAIDAGDDAAALDPSGAPLAADQRGGNRISHHVDIGAVEREILGDYNGDGSVDAIDYTVWRNYLGSTTQLVADGDGNGKVEEHDYRIWKNHYGKTTGADLSANYGIQVVSILADENDGNVAVADLSLREAIGQAAAHAGQDIIVFRHELQGQTITLNAPLGDMTINSNVDVWGPGKDLLKIDGANTGLRIFRVASGVTTNIEGLTMTRGGSTSAFFGGAIWSLGNTTLTGVTISNNTAQNGGGLYHFGGSLTIKNSSIVDNLSATAGGISVASATGFVLESSTVARNTTSVQGGIYIYNTNFDAINSTISSNTSSSGISGGMYLIGGSQNYVKLTNVTVTNNYGGSSYGGGILIGSSSLNVTLNNTIVAGNSNIGGASDVSGSFNPASAYNIIGSTFTSTGLTGSTNLTGTTSNPQPAGLGPLGFYGGPTETHALLVGSPAVDSGGSALALNAAGQPLTLDQRGYNRITGVAVDRGAVESSSGSALVVGTLVDETDGNHTPADLSLREALALASQLYGVETIQFAAGLTGTLTLSLGELAISGQAVDVVGPGADVLTISGGGVSRVFNISSGAAVTLRDLRIANGNGSGSTGGGISTVGNLTLRGVALENNTAIAGGGLYATGGTLAIFDSTVANNNGAYIAGGVGAANTAVTIVNSTISTNTTQYSGGGVYVSGGSLTIDHSTITQNRVTVAAAGGGGLYATGLTSVVRHTIIADNFSAPGLTEDNVTGALSSAQSMFNLIGLGGAGGLTHGVGGNKVGVADPGLGALALNGGRTRTHALLAGSQAIDAGDLAISLPPSSDQRGKSRISDGDDDLTARIDIGAFELAADEYFGSI